MRIAALLLAVSAVVSACGGRIAVDADADSGGAGDDGTMGGDGSCAAKHCVDASPVCPATVPPGGSSCLADGQVCDGWSPGCGTKCTCKANHWSCTDTCTQCPPPPRNGGSCAGQIGLYCKYDVGCATFVECHCNDATDGAHWACDGQSCDGGGR